MSRPHHLFINGQDYIIHPAVGAWLLNLCGYAGDVKIKLADALGKNTAKLSREKKRHGEKAVRAEKLRRALEDEGLRLLRIREISRADVWFERNPGEESDSGESVAIRQREPHFDGDTEITLTAVPLSL